MTLRPTPWLALSLVLLLVPGLAHGAAFTNGSFETGPDPGTSPGFATLLSGNTSITGWTVSNNTIDYIGPYWAAADGARSLDLDGTSVQGAVSQAFDTVSGASYLVRFWMAGNPDAGSATKNLRVSAGLDLADFSFDTTGRTRTDMGWVEKSFLFVATGLQATLTFASLTPGGDPANCCYGPALDDVSVTAVPEPTSLLLFGTMLVGVGVAARRRWIKSRALEFQ